MFGEAPEVRLTPKFLTKELIAQAVEDVLGLVMFAGCTKSLLKRHACHLVVLVPSMKDDRQDDYPKWPNYPIEPYCAYEKSMGDRENWSADYENIAKCKALQLWTGRNDDRTDIQPHLLFSGDVPFWGGVKRHGIVVACSGFQPYFDKMVSGMVIDMIVALAYHAWMESEEKKTGAYELK